jgi:hypothetical protein
MDKEARQKVSKYKKLKDDELKNNDDLWGAVDNILKYDEKISEEKDKAKKRSQVYKSDEGQQLVDKQDEFEKVVDKYGMSGGGNDGSRLDSHDKNQHEYYADLYAMKHGNTKHKFTDEARDKIKKASHADNDRKYRNMQNSNKTTQISKS